MRFFKRPTEGFWRTTLLALLVGAVSGTLGAVAAWSSLLAYQGSVLGSERASLLGTRRQAASSDAVFLRTFGEEHSRQVAAIFIARTDPAAPFLPHEALGSGVVLTNDGWILSHESVVSPSRMRELRIGVGPAILPVDQLIEDTETGALFLRVAATNLTPAVFSERREFSAGDPLFSVLATGAVYEAKILDAQGRDESFVIPDRPETRMAFRDDLPASTVGAPLFMTNGTVAGMVVTRTDGGRVGLAAHELARLLPALLAGESLTRPALGARGLEVTHGWYAGGGRSRGFLIQGDRRQGIAALVPGSPAVAAGLRAGDIIIKINDTAVGGSEDFSELLLAFSPQDVIDLTVVRGAEELVAPVRLGSRIVSRVY